MKVLIFDMYGVIIKESKGNFIPYTFNYLPHTEHDNLIKLFKQDKLFTQAGNGEITSSELLNALGFKDPVYHMKDYIENHLTIDNDFYSFAESNKTKYDFVLLSNDVSDWSKYITEYYDLNRYFKIKIISGDVYCRKPDLQIFNITMQKISSEPKDCIFIDNSVENLITATKLGMDTILFNRDNEEYDGKVVYSFDELSYIIDNNLT